MFIIVLSFVILNFIYRIIQQYYLIIVLHLTYSIIETSNFTSISLLKLFIKDLFAFTITNCLHSITIITATLARVVTTKVVEDYLPFN